MSKLRENPSLNKEFRNIGNWVTASNENMAIAQAEVPKFKQLMKLMDQARLCFSNGDVSKLSKLFSSETTTPPDRNMIFYNFMAWIGNTIRPTEFLQAFRDGGLNPIQTISSLEKDFLPIESIIWPVHSNLKPLNRQAALTLLTEYLAYLSIDGNDGNYEPSVELCHAYSAMHPNLFRKRLLAIQKDLVAMVQKDGPTAPTGTGLNILYKLKSSEGSVMWTKPATAVHVHPEDGFHPIQFIYQNP